MNMQMISDEIHSDTIAIRQKKKVERNYKDNPTIYLWILIISVSAYLFAHMDSYFIFSLGGPCRPSG